MTDPLNILILFGVGILAGFLNVMAGGGSSITLPVLIFMGLDAATANGTNRVAILLQNVSAVKSFRNEQYSETGTSLKLALLTLPGAVIGAIAAVRITDDLFETILGIIMIFIIISMVIPRKKKNYDVQNKKVSWPVAIAMIGVGFYGGFIQVGVGFLLMSALHYLMKLNLVYVNMHKVFIVLIYTIPALLIFAFSGNINWLLGLSLAAGNALGAWQAAKYSVKKGEGVIKVILIIAVAIMSLKLLNVF